MRGLSAYWARISERYAEALGDAIERRTRQIELFPDSGAVLPGHEVLEIRYLVESSYRIVYVVTPDYIAILGVVHTSRRPL